MKPGFIYMLCIFIVLSLNSIAQPVVWPDYWTWVKGSDAINVKGKYGVRGVSDKLNDAGGRSDAGYWTDTNGNFYVFAGRGYGAVSIIAGFVNDLWRYSPTTNEWTWLKGDTTTNPPGNYGNKGVSAAANNPGSRYRFPTWKDKDGVFWIFGGYGTPSSLPTNRYLNDLWSYSPYTNEWTWVSGQNIGNINGAYGTLGVPSSGNMPGGREGAAGWMDTAGNFWIFGGSGYGNDPKTSGVLNDLWKYDRQADNWTWIAGDSSINKRGIYGTKNTAAPDNKPAARKYSAYWTDAEGNFWLFGGSAENTNQYLNDLWRYNVEKNEWTWISGDSTFNTHAVYGTLYTPAENNMPSARMGAGAWTEANGQDLWLMSGSGIGTDGTGYLNDLWLYNIRTGKWTWVSGDSTINVNGVYGQKEIGDATNKVNGRYYSAGKWSNGKGKLWVYGGHARGASGTTFGYLNDIWKLDVCFLMERVSEISGLDSICRNTSATYKIPALEHADFYIWSLPDGWTGESQTEEINITAGTEGGIITIKAVSNCDTVEVQKELYVNNIEANITVNGFELGTTQPYLNYQWYFNGKKIEDATNRYITVKENGDYTVVVSDEMGCTDTSDKYTVTNVPVGISTTNWNQEINIYPNPAANIIHIVSPHPVTALLSGLEGKTLIRREHVREITVKDLPSGLYLLKLFDEKGNLVRVEKIVRK